MWKPSLSERHKKFAREVGSVVLGVLIALGLGEIATSIRWRFDATDARSAMLADFQRDAGVMHERMLVWSCIERRLRDVDGIIRKAKESGVLPMIGTIGRPPIRPVVTAAWDTAVSSAVLPHLSRADADGFSTNFDMINEMAADMKEQSRLWARLAVLEGTPGPVSPEVLAELMFTTAELRKGSAYVDMVAGQIVATGKQIGKLDYWLILDRENGVQADVIAWLRTRPICKPLLVDGKPYAG